jgi:hypothetical protein
MKKQDKFTWWMPGKLVRLTLYGTPQTKLQWVRGTWRIYLAYWRVVVEIANALRDISQSAKSKDGAGS